MTAGPVIGHIVRDSQVEMEVAVSALTSRNSKDGLYIICKNRNGSILGTTSHLPAWAIRTVLTIPKLQTRDESNVRSEATNRRILKL
ncbi:hypothetical protein VTK56DRAFT_9677 [Thermocarpiscus australiensis]